MVIGIAGSIQRGANTHPLGDNTGDNTGDSPERGPAPWRPARLAEMAKPSAFA